MAGADSYAGTTLDDGDTDAKIALAQAIYARIQPAPDTPAEVYATKTRRIPVETVRACADLGYVPSPIEGRPPQDHALASLLRDSAGEVSGFQLEFCDILGARTEAEKTKQTYNLRVGGLCDGLFRAGGSGDVAYLCEGYSCKPLAVASLGIGPVYGGGGRKILGTAAPPEDTVVIVPDRRPEDKTVDPRTGRSAGTAHDHDYKRAVDLLLLAGKTVRIAKAPECTHPGGGACKDADDVLRRHGPILLREQLERTEDSGLSLDGEARKLAQIEDPLERDQATKARATALKVGVALLRDRVVHHREQAGRRTRTRTAPADTAPDVAALAASAADIIASKDVLELFADTISGVVAGERANVKILYLVATSRLLDRVMSAAVKGPSSAGKSEVRRRTLKFFPGEDVITFTTLSEKALLYFEGDFAHKILSMGEASDPEEQQLQDYLLRELISEGRLQYPVVQKCGDAHTTVVIEKNGPTTFVVTTTRTSLESELETRLLSLEADDTAAQTRLVLHKVAEVEGANDGEPALADLERWHDYQRWLAAGPKVVTVPFAGMLAELVSAKAVRLRRDFGQLLRAIKTHALLHRAHRARERGEIVATIEDDYAVVARLLGAVMAHTAGLAISPTAKETIAAVAQLSGTAAGQTGVTALEVGKALSLDKSSARRRLKAAVVDGHLVNLETRRGQPGWYVVSADTLEASQLLPTTEELLRAYTSCDKPENPVPPCHRSQESEQDQDVSGGKALATGVPPLATDVPPLIDNEADGSPVAAGGKGVQPPVPPVTPCDTSENGDRWHGGKDFVRSPEGTHPGGNGPGPDVRCGYCTMVFLPGDEPVEIDGAVYHSDDACAGTIRCRRAASAASPPPPQPSPPPAGKRRRVKGADTTPGVKGLPE